MAKTTFCSDCGEPEDPNDLHTTCNRVVYCNDCGEPIKNGHFMYDPAHAHCRPKKAGTARRKRRFRRKLFIKQGGLCGICGERLRADPLDPSLNVDHIVPRAYGGGNHPENLQLVHVECNTAKGSDVDPVFAIRKLTDWGERIPDNLLDLLEKTHAKDR